MATQTVSLKFQSGIDTKSDPKLVVPTKLVTLQNGIFTNTGRITKRNGYDQMTNALVGGGTWSSPTMCSNYRDELLIAATTSNGQRLLSYSGALNAWSDRGKYLSIAVSKDIIDAPELDGIPDVADPGVSGPSNSSCATLNNISLYAYDTGYAQFSSAVYITVVDNQTGAHLADQVSILSAMGNSRGFSKAVILGNSAYAVFYIGDSVGGSTPSATAKLCLRIISITQGGGVVVGSEIVIGPCLATPTAVSSGPGFYYCYDAVTTASGAVIISASEPDVDLYSIDTTGSIIHSVTIVSASPITPVSVTLDSTGTNAWFYWVADGILSTYAVYSVNTFSVVFGPTTIASTSPIQQICALPISATTQIFYFSIYTTPGTGQTIGVFYPEINFITVTTSGPIGSPGLLLPGADIYSKITTIGGRNYMAVVTLSQSNPIGFLVDLSPDNGSEVVTVAKFLISSAEGVYKFGYNTSDNSYVAPTLILVRYPGFINPIINNTSENIYSLCCGFVVSLDTLIPSSSSAGAAYPLSSTIGAQTGMCSIDFDFDNINSFQSIIQQDTLLLNGGIVEQYDGNYISELGFNIDPDGVSLITQSTGGFMETGSRVYYIVFRWVDSNGNLHQSSPSIGTVVVNASGSTNFVTGYYNTPVTLTQKKNVNVAIYRTIADGTIAFLVGSQNSSFFGIFVDGQSDAVIQLNPSMYTEGGAILENIAPPSAMILWSNNNRAWCVDSENPETTIEYSKTASQGTGISFSSGQLELVIDSTGGSITGASKMDEKTIILKKSDVGYFYGDGANDAGTGSSISNFQFIPSDVGCTNSNSVLLYPGGVIFRSPKGIYQINRGVQVQYLGVDVEAFNSQNILSAEIIGNRNQIRFLTSSGSSLLYDYFFNQWSTFTNHQGLSATIWNGDYVYVRSDGTVYLENSTSFLDNSTSIALFAQTAWIKANTIQNFQRARLFEILGDYSSPVSTYGVQLSFAYDFVLSFTSTQPFYFSSNPGSAIPFQERVFTARQKCDAIQVQIAELPTGASGEFVDFTDLDMEIAVKTGLNKLPAAFSTG